MSDIPHPFFHYCYMLFDSRAPHLNQVLLKSLDVPTPLYGIRKPYPNYESLSVASSLH